ncbi:8921_t:CDS:2 [Cetraspora pellucida]|uniref:8921_t:CDS:1 n=1 Tax=Cetraspora pellucida TaxID=1433469 RepID=A0A9N9D1R7_9GLOM|nr:8921_t:CDS:2 [Cetraspora pellucida]
MESNNNKPSNPDPQAYYFLDLDIEYAKDIFKVDKAEYAFSTWFTEIEKLNFETRITKK